MASKIECSRYAETEVGGIKYIFERDREGRFVATVHNDDHVEILLAVVHYRPYDENAFAKKPAAPAMAAAPKPAAEPTPPAPPPPGITDPGNTPPPPPPPGDPLDHDGDGKKGGSLPRTPEPDPEDVTRISGIGAGLKSRLEEAGFTKLSQIAALTDSDAAALDEMLKLHGRIAREKWVEQAKSLIG